MFNLILFGPPGSGKGTQSEKLIERYGLKHLSTGDLLRSEISNHTRLGLEAKRYMDQGALVPDEVVIGMIREALVSNPDVNGFLFDGFPRTDAQAKALDELLEQNNTAIDIVLAIQVQEDELINRLLNRGLTSGRSDDISEGIIKTRIAEYHKKTSPVADYYNRFNKVVKISGEGKVEAIFNALCEQIDRRQVRTA